MEFYRVFCLYRRKMTIDSNIFCRFQLQRYADIFQNGDLKCPKTEKGCNHPLTDWLWQLTTLIPGYVVPPICFHQNDSKRCKRDYLYALDHSLWRFGATRKTPSFRANTPLVRRGLNEVALQNPLISDPHNLCER